jgi:RluA family pseudouridine synthase
LSLVPILAKSNDWLVVDKPHGISVHNNEDPENLIQILSQQLQITTLFPVHRLDKETSGVQAFALNKKSAQILSEEFQAHRVRKIYLGLVKGVIKQKKGTWSQPLTDKAEGRKNPQGLAKNRVPSLTEYEVIQESRYLSLCQFHLLTGRQHQIRKHSAMAGHPLVGDPRYGTPTFNKKVKQLYGTDRMYLHCLEMVIVGQVVKSQMTPEFKVFF